MTDLSKLAKVDPHSVWADEARDFTPWLLENADLLAETLGIDLELEQTEQPVGGFSVDLVGRDLANDAVLIVENQLDRTNHTHLGQVMTYAAGTGASTIVWIATRFREEHRQALDWLNEETGEKTRFFGIELEVVQIDGSNPAPLLNLVAEPNDWQKQVRAATRARSVFGKGAYYVEFWGKLLEKVRNEHPTWTRARTARPDSWIAMPSGVAGTFIACSFALRRRVRHELYIDCGDAERNLEIFQTFASQRERMEATYGRPLEFEELPGRQACRVADYTDGDVTDVDRHEALIDFFLDSGVRMRKALNDVEISFYE